MGEDINRDGLQQQSDEAARNAPGQQNQHGQPRDPADGVEGPRTKGLEDGLEGGVDTGAIQPGDTGQP